MATAVTSPHAKTRKVLKALLVSMGVGSVVFYALKATGIRWSERRLAENQPQPNSPPDTRAARHRSELNVDREPCAGDQVLVGGQYCDRAEERCLEWLDDPRLPFARCGKFDAPSRCIGSRVAMRFCIDRYEYTRPGAQLPENWASFSLASQVCAERGKRVCSEAEWNFACEGEEMRPYPYGFSRQPLCNQDRLDLLVNGAHGQALRDWREPSGTRPQCVSPFGVYDMVGNLDEPVLHDVTPPGSRFRGALKGGWWMPARNRCRPETVGHDIFYRGLQVGIRCCSDAVD